MLRGSASEGGLESGAHFGKRKHGYRELKPFLGMDSLVAVAVGGQRLDILRTLVESPMSVSALADAMFLGVKCVSRELAILEVHGLVWSTRQKNHRIYDVTSRVKAIRSGAMIQMTIADGHGRWSLFHFDDGGTDDPVVPPPDYFVD